MSDSSRTRLIYKVEASFAEVPGANPSTTLLRTTGDSLDHKNTTVISDEIRSDRQRSDLILTGYDAGGDINQELIYGGAFETWLEAVLCGTWAALDETTPLTTTNGQPTIVIPSGTVTFNAGDVGKTITALAGVPGGTTILSVQDGTHATMSANASAGGSTTATIVGRYGRLRNGTTNRSFLIEKGWLDLGKYLSLRGCSLNKLAVDITARKQIMMVTSWLAAQGYITSSSVAGSTTPTAAVANEVARAGDLIALADAGTANVELVGQKVKRITLDINNNLRQHELATAYQSDDFGRGAMTIQGTLETYLTGSVIYAALKANSVCALRFTIKDPSLASDNTYQITMPRVKLSAAPAPTGGVDSDVMQAVSFTALYDSGVGYTIDVQRNLTT